MKNLTDFRKTVETGMDPRLSSEKLVLFKLLPFVFITVKNF